MIIVAVVCLLQEHCSIDAMYTAVPSLSITGASLHEELLTEKGECEKDHLSCIVEERAYLKKKKLTVKMFE